MGTSAIGNFCSKALRVLVKFTSGLSSIATFWTFLLVFFVTADVVGRFIFKHPFTGTPEIVSASLVGIAFLYMPHTVWVGKQIRSDLLNSLLKPWFKCTMAIISPLAGVIVFFLISFTNWPDMMEAFRTGEWEGQGDLHVPVAPFRVILVGGAALTALYYAVQCGKGIWEVAVQRGRKA
jgi:TRAP-type C4-dicarboxylate transport system permease small subunit